jgi:hypothetical protein
MEIVSLDDVKQHTHTVTWRVMATAEDESRHSRMMFNERTGRPLPASVPATTLDEV